jgi:hypothetical protein
MKSSLFKKSFSKTFFTESFFKNLIYVNFKYKKFQIFKELRADIGTYYYADREFFKKYNVVFGSITISSFLWWILEYHFLFEKISNKKNKGFNETYLKINENNRVFYNLSRVFCFDQEEINFAVRFLLIILFEKLNSFFLKFVAQILIMMFCLDFKKHKKKKIQ